MLLQFLYFILRKELLSERDGNFLTPDQPDQELVKLLRKELLSERDGNPLISFQGLFLFVLLRKELLSERDGNFISIIPSSTI